MAGNSSPQRVIDSMGGIGPGTVIGGRFQIEEEHHVDALGTTWQAKDTKTGKSVAIREVSPDIVGSKAQFDPLREQIKHAAKLKHRNLVATYGVGTHAGTAHFVAHEWVRGNSMQAVLERRQASGKPMSLRGIYNAITHVCKGLAALHESGTQHGLIRPGAIFISKAGRVKLAEIGQAHYFAGAGCWNRLPPEEHAFVAPEIKRGEPASPASDVYGVGATLYALLTLRAPDGSAVAPSQVHPDADSVLDGVVQRCLSAAPGDRYGSALEIVSDLLPLVATAPEADPGDFDVDVDVEVDIDIAASLSPPAPADNGPAAAPVAKAPLAKAPVAKAPVAAKPPVPAAPPKPPRAAAPAPPAPPRASAPRGLPQPVRPAGAAAPPTPEKGPDLNNLVEDLLKNDSSRWMAVKDGMDHGPFTTRELIKLIIDGEVLEENFLLNMSTNERKPLSEYAEFNEFIAQQKLRREEKDYQAALERTNKVEKRSTIAKFAVLSGAVLLVLGIGGSYLMSRQAASRAAKKSDVELANLYESGNVKISGTAGILKHTPRRKGSGGGARKRSGAGGGFSSYEDAMNTAMDIGSAAKGGGERQLTSADVAGTMNRNLNSLFSCVSQELRRGGRLGTVRIDLAILGNGSVMGASVNTGSGAFKKCIAGKVRRIRFASFPAPRMGARYSFDVD